jgi:hypothetical protein
MKASAGNRVLMLIENNTFPQDTRVRYEVTTLVDAGYRVSVISQAMKRLTASRYFVILLRPKP